MNGTSPPSSSSSLQQSGVVEFEPNEGGTIPRLVEISFNLVSILDVDEKRHGFRVYVRIGLTWDCSPLTDQYEFFRPHFIIDNVRSVERVQSFAYSSDKELASIAKYRKAKGEPAYAMDMGLYCVDFVSRLELQSFPFDLQVFSMNFWTEYPQLCTLSELCVRHPETKLGVPLVTDDGENVVNQSFRGTIRSFSLSNWFALVTDKTFSDGSKEALLNKRPEVLLSYRFGQLYKANRSNPQFLKVSFVMQRRYTNVLIEIVTPSFLLSFASLSTFALKYDPNAESRLSILFTIILTIIANQYTIHEELPKLPYLTWVDYALKGYELFVYLLILENAILSQVSEENLARADQIVFFFSIAVYVTLNVVLIITAIVLLKKRTPKVDAFINESEASFDAEQKRMCEDVYNRPDLYKPWKESIKEEKMFYPVGKRTADYIFHSQKFMGQYFMVNDLLKRQKEYEARRRAATPAAQSDAASDSHIAVKQPF